MLFLHTRLVIAVIVLQLASCEISKSVSSLSAKNSLRTQEELILRIRLPDGSIKRASANPTDTISDVCDKIECDYESGVATDAEFSNCIEGSSMVQDLKLVNGDWLYIKKDSSEGTRDNAEAIMRMKKQRQRELKGSGVVECNTMAKLEQEIKDAGNMLVVIDFYADWCGPCKNIAPKYKSMADEYPKAVLLKVNVDKNRDASEKYSVSSMPTFIFIKRGKIVDTLKGADESSLRSKIKSYL